MFSVHCNVIA